ncbi:MAG: TetR/AcrR family transcriptional regulator [Bacteroidales bacterium]|nr:TetR/AcrR family transcriptional regulator [Bacteroidales bacterium]
MKERIMKTARELFRKRGLRDVNIDEICHELGMSKKTFYIYYESKEALVGSIVDADVTLYHEAFRKRIQGKDLVGMTVEMLEVYRRGFSDPDRRIREDIVKLYPEVFRRHAEKKMKIFKGEFRELFDRGVAEGLYRKDIDYELCVLQMFLLKRGILSYLRGDTTVLGHRRSAKSMVSNFMEVIMNTFLTEDGRLRCRALMEMAQDGRKHIDNK